MGLLRQFADMAPGESLRRCLGTIAERDPDIEAWVAVAPRQGGPGPLAGLPYGAKDIYETRDLPTEYGSPLFRGRQGVRDAALIDMLSAAGAVLLGKTHTTAFAYFDPAPTRNPCDPRHTPGGSSSGSAAAVRAGMAAFALGSQTQGSVIRPASFCGVVGFKPTFGLIPVDGMLPFSPSLDTAGFFTQDAGDMQHLWAGLGNSASIDPSPRIGAIASYGEPDEPMRAAIAATLASWRAAGVAVEAAELPDGFGEVWPAVQVINHYEGARTHEERYREHGAGIGAKLAHLVERGLAISGAEYEEARATLAEHREALAPLWRHYGVLALASAPGPAPLGLASTGDPRMNGAWTGLGVPALSLPMPVEGLPLGIQLVAAPGEDALLLATAAHLEILR
ncbi:MAG: amidase [Bryobacterales bacterium]|nr:amidase [Bryobacterales bacterium]